MPTDAVVSGTDASLHASSSSLSATVPSSPSHSTNWMGMLQERFQAKFGSQGLDKWRFEDEALPSGGFRSHVVLVDADDPLPWSAEFPQKKAARHAAAEAAMSCGVLKSL